MCYSGLDGSARVQQQSPLPESTCDAKDRNEFSAVLTHFRDIYLRTNGCIKKEIKQTWEALLGACEPHPLGLG